MGEELISRESGPQLLCCSASTSSGILVLASPGGFWRSFIRIHAMNLTVYNAYVSGLTMSDPLSAPTEGALSMSGVLDSMAENGKHGRED